jgi:hypothetical protein
MIPTAGFYNAFAVPYQKYGFANVGGQFRLDTSKLSRFGEFKIDERKDVIQF